MENLLLLTWLFFCWNVLFVRDKKSASNSGLMMPGRKYHAAAFIRMSILFVITSIINIIAQSMDIPKYITYSNFVVMFLSLLFSLYHACRMVTSNMP